MKTLQELNEYLEFHELDCSVFLSEEETIQAIIGHDDATGALIYDYDRLVKGFMEHFDDGTKSEDELYEDAVEWIEYNTKRSLPYKIEGKVMPIIMNGVEEYIFDNTLDGVRTTFDAKVETEEVIKWIKDWFDQNGPGCNAIIGISGGKDSTIAAALCAKALGPDRVIGVSMPDVKQGINEADEICKFLGIRYMRMPISSAVNAFRTIWSDIADEDFKWSEQSLQNIPPRIRMTMLYAIAQSNNGRVVGTCNASENYVGYFTRYGDGASDFEPLGNFTVRQVKEIGYQLDLPKKWVDKVPDDGLPFSCPDDEKFEKMGFNYAKLDAYIETGTSGDPAADEAIEKMHNKTKFKLNMGTYYPYFKNLCP